MPGLRRVNNPKRQFSRKSRRHHRAIDSSNMYVNPKPGGFFAQHSKQFTGYVGLLAVMAFVFSKASILLAGAWIMSLILPLLWFVRYTHSKRLMARALNDEDSTRKALEQLN